MGLNTRDVKRAMKDDNWDIYVEMLGIKDNIAAQIFLAVFCVFVLFVILGIAISIQSLAIWYILNLLGGQLGFHVTTSTALGTALALTVISSYFKKSSSN